MSKSSVLLKVVSILFIIFGAIALIITIAGMVLGGMVAAIGAGILAVAMIIVLILALLEALLMLFAGILGVKGDKIKACTVMSIIILALSIISLIMGIVQGGFQWTSLISIILPVLYFIGVRQTAAK
ncbi:MAG: hypothetical protein RSG57_00745 [Christensenellaceae bacterium]